MAFPHPSDGHWVEVQLEEPDMRPGQPFGSIRHLESTFSPPESDEKRDNTFEHSIKLFTWTLLSGRLFCACLGVSRRFSGFRHRWARGKGRHLLFGPMISRYRRAYAGLCAPPALRGMVWWWWVAVCLWAQRPMRGGRWLRDLSRALAGSLGVAGRAQR